MVPFHLDSGAVVMLDPRTNDMAKSAIGEIDYLGTVEMRCESCAARTPFAIYADFGARSLSERNVRAYCEREVTKWNTDIAGRTLRKDKICGWRQTCTLRVVVTAIRFLKERECLEA